MSKRPSRDRSSPSGWRSSPSFAERGYALPLVLFGIALCLIYASQTAARTVREASIAKLKANAEIAYYAAESGFNRARARLIGGGLVAEVAALHNTVETLFSDSGEPAGRYSLLVTTIDGPNGIYYVKSTGTYGTGKYRATQIVSGTISLKNPSNLTVPRPVHTDYD